MNSQRKTLFILVIVIMMFTWPIFTAVNSGIMVGQQSSDETSISFIYDRPLTPQERVTILRAGRMLVEYYYTTGENSLDKLDEYRSLSEKFPGYVILELVKTEYSNETRNEMITPEGDIIPLANVSGEDLVDTFCENALVMPRECLLRSV